MADHLLINAENVIINIIEWDNETQPYTPPEGYLTVLVTDGMEADIGWIWENGKAINPNPETNAGATPKGGMTAL